MSFNIESMYKTHNPIKCLGKRYKPEGNFEYAVPVRVAVLKPPKDSDGLVVEVFETRCPTSFYSLKIKTNKGIFVIDTGSGMGELIGTLAIQYSEGMLGIDRQDEQTINFIKEL